MQQPAAPCLGLRLAGCRAILSAAVDHHSEPGGGHFAAVFEAAVDAILVIDHLGSIERVNPAVEKMFGWGAAELLGRNVKVLMPAPYREEHDGYLERHLRTGENRIIGIGREVTGLRRDGTRFPAFLSVGEVVTDERRSYVGILRDITAQKAAEAAREQLIEELEAKNAELERFTYTVSHDLKSPLITIKGFVSQLERSVTAGKMDRFRSDVARIAGAADKLTELLDDVLQLSRIGRLVNPPEDVPLEVIVDQVRELLSASIQSAGAEVVVEDELPVVRGDRVRLVEIVQNLVENALKFCKDAPRIEIGARVEGRMAICHVRDNGIGIEPQYFSRVFGLFEQLDGASPGTGIGLALVRRIVEVHGGKIWVESKGLGHGTTMCFSLPLASKDHEP
jgi:two-component system sensor kinase FixL